jgi:tRNA(Ile)-lysidine synthetase-like protein
MPRAMQPPHGPSLPAPNVGSGTSPNTGAGVDLNRRFAEEMGAFLGPDFPSDIGLAVSGGGDSMAMLHLAAPWARVMGIRLWVATIDHGLRAESAAEAALVAQACTDLGLSHSTLKWDGWDGKGNLQASARAARHDLLGRWRGSVQHIAFGHTEDDQAETVLMRLTRGSGVEGLSGMSARQTISDTALPNLDSSAWTLLRPLLPTTRAELRHYLRVLHIPYVDDPTNDDLTYDRVKARKALDILAPLGLTAQTLAQTATRMARAVQHLSTALLMRPNCASARHITTCNWTATPLRPSTATHNCGCWRVPCKWLPQIPTARVRRRSKICSIARWLGVTGCSTAGMFSRGEAHFG